MRIIIYGAGGIGSVVGGLLWRTGQEVVLVGRPGHITVIQTRSLKLITPDETFQLNIPAVTSPGQIDFRSDDVVFLCMKGQNTEDALRELRSYTQDVPLFCLQNGVRNEETSTGYFSRVYGAMIRIGAEYLTDGEVACRRDPPGWMIIGLYPRGTDVLCEEVAQRVRAAGFLAKTTADVMPYKWGKLFANLGNAIDAITGSRGKESEIIAYAAGQEFKALLQQAGIFWISQEEVAREWPEVNQPPRNSLKTMQYSSTWQSLTRQQGSVETEFLNGEIVRLARKLGREAPVNEKLLQITQAMAANHEKPGKYSLMQLLSLVGLDVPSGR
jgi:2-dehydropantoate 2-reductase